MSQQALDLTAIALGEATIERRFRQFHRDNPGVYRELVHLARQAKAAGQERIGMKLLFEVIRWNRLLSTRDAEGFRLNNIYTSRYARLIADNEPDLADMFEIRELKRA